jgi:periplasmic divalent cation tolerance protein
MTEFVQVTTAVANRQQADVIATALIQRSIAGCVQIIGAMHSVYRWQGEVERSEECLLLIKTSIGQYAAVESAIRELHSYECPEVIATPIVAGSTDYLGWLSAETAPTG